MSEAFQKLIEMAKTIPIEDTDDNYRRVAEYLSTMELIRDVSFENEFDDAFDLACNLDETEWEKVRFCLASYVNLMLNSTGLSKDIELMRVFNEKI